MPLTVVANEATQAGPTTRKRTFDQITRSQSRSITPSAPSPKRRRTTNFVPPLADSQMSSRDATPSYAPRYPRDGLDYRRPTQLAIAQAEAHTTIDLTQDDDDHDYQDEAQGIPRSRSLAPSDFSIDLASLQADESSRAQSRVIRAESERLQRRRRAATEVIDITGDENDVSSDDSSDIEILGSRPRQQHAGHINQVLPSSQPMLRRHDAQSWVPGEATRTFRSFMGHNVPQGFGGLGFLDSVNNLMGGTLQHLMPGHGPSNTTTYDNMTDLGLDDYDNIQMDFGIPAEFMEDPLPLDQQMEAYKPPPAATMGFTRDIEEEGDVLVCASCEEELATGDENEPKAQVWVSKKCGHVYCGACVTHRAVYRRGNDRDRSRAKQPKLDDLKECKVAGCHQKLTAKTAMFQIYL